MTSRLFKNVSAKFRELDADGSGLLEGEELLQMAAWILRLSSTSRVYEPTLVEVIEARDRILRTFDKHPPDAVIGMGELAIVHDQILVGVFYLHGV